MSKQAKTMPLLDLHMCVRVVAGVFCVSTATAFVMASLRLFMPELYYCEPIGDTHLVLHYLSTGLMMLMSSIGFINSSVVINRKSAENSGRNITMWLLFDSLFETMRVVYMFVGEIVLQGKGTLQVYELVLSAAQYLLDSFLYCQMILRH